MEVCKHGPWFFNAIIHCLRDVIATFLHNGLTQLREDLQLARAWQWIT